MAGPIAKWRQWAAGAFAAVALAGLGFVVGRGSFHEAAPAAPGAAPPPPVVAPSPSPPIVEAAALRRRDLLTMVAAAASAYAAGQPATDQDLIGRPFEVRLPFGCAGPRPPTSGEDPRWEIDPETQTWRLVAEPQSWLGDPLLGDLLAAGQLEAARGFWVRRPWLLAEHCPKGGIPNADIQGAAGEPGSVGLVSIFRRGGSRIEEAKHRSLEVSRKFDPENAPTEPHEFDLVLRGRIGDFGEGRAIRCQAETVDERPRCLVSVDLDDVRMVDPASGETLADWSS